jgi:superfamily II DNA/RNA helicase
MFNFAKNFLQRNIKFSNSVYGNNLLFKSNLNNVSYLYKNNYNELKLLSTPLKHFSNKLDAKSQIKKLDEEGQKDYDKYELTYNKREYAEYDPEDYEEKLKEDTLIRRAYKEESNALSFKEFRLLPEIYNVLDKLKFFAPTSIQSVAIPKIMEKKHIFYSSQTGTGKTLSYVLPIIHELKSLENKANERLTTPKRPKVLVLVPSRELAQQVEEVFKLFVYDVPLVVESLFVGKKFSFERKSSKEGVDILISTPDRFKNHWDKKNVYVTKLTHVVIDELDTLLDSGYDDFLKKISNIILKYNTDEIIQNSENSTSEKPPSNFRQLIYASATLTPSIENYLADIFEKNENNLNNSFLKIIDKSTNHNLANVKHEFLHVTDYDKYPTLLKIINDNIKIIKQNMSIIIFCNSINCARKTELTLKENNLSTACLHGDIPPLRRKFELQKFKNRRARVLICTDLIARGLDFPFVYLVINFDFPRTLSDYLHRSGRTGRAGQKGVVISFYRNNNLHVIEKIKKAHQLNLPMEVENSMYSLRKTLDDKKKFTPRGNAMNSGRGRKKLTSNKTDGITLSQRKYNSSPSTPLSEEDKIIRMKKKKIMFENFRKKTETDRNTLLRKALARNQRKQAKNNKNIYNKKR